LSLVLAVVLAAGSAFAFWSANGAGDGSGSTATVTAVTLSPGVAAADLRPGGVGAVVLRVTNPNDAAADVGSLALDVSQGDDGFAVDAAHAGCGLEELTYTTQTNAGAGWTIPARVGGEDGTLSITLPDAIAMSGDAANACQGANLTIYLVVGA
jgi:hypothetical protein